MRLIIHLIILTFLIAGFGNLQSTAQCCSAGNPISTDGSSGGITKNAFTVAFMYKNSLSDSYYHGSEKTDFIYKESSFHFSSLKLEYGINSKLAVAIDNGFFIRKSEYFPESDYERYARGLGDVGLTLRYNFLNMEEQRFSMSVIGTVKFPIGAKNQQYDGIILPIDFQPSTGSMRFNPAISMSKAFSPRFSMFGFGSYEYINEIETESATYKYGDIAVAALGANYLLTEDLSFNLQGRYEWRGKRVDNGSEIKQSTGGKIFFLVPELSYTIFSSIRVAVAYDQPVVRYMNYLENGTGQLGNKRMITLKASSVINELIKPKAVQFNDLTLLNVSNMHVSGICGMCKLRIEKIAMRSRNVKYASWDVSTQELTLKHKEEIDLHKIMERLAKAGHDTEEIKASDKAYANLHECCKYRVVNQ